MNKLLKFLQSNQAVLAAATMSLSTQLWHSVNAFVHLDKGGADNYWNYLFGILFSVSTSFAILLFTVRGRKNLAYFFLVVEVFINVIHYNLLSMEMSTAFFATLFMCLIVPVTISVYSSEIDPTVAEEKISPPVTNISQNNINIVPDNSGVLAEINKAVGFNVSDPNDYSGNLPPYEKQRLKDLWKANGATNPQLVKDEVNKLLAKPTGKLLF